MTALRRLELRQKVKNIGRPLKCPLCGFRFSFRHHQRADRRCPHCKVPIGYSPWYRKLVAGTGLLAAGLVMYLGLGGDDANGWLLAGLPLAFAAAVAVQVFILRAFPPKLEPYTEGDTWLKLS